MSKPKWSDEPFGSKHASDKIKCKDCLFRPCTINGVKLDRASTSCCGIYEYPESKPDNVYFDGTDCEYYEKAD